MATKPNAETNPPKAKLPAPIVTGVVTGIQLPAAKPTRGGGASIYPFDTLTEVGAMFGVKGRDKRGLASALSNANRKYRKAITDEAGNPVYETKPMTGADGVVTHIPDTSKPKTVAERHFIARDVDKDTAAAIKGTELEGCKVIVIRDK